MPKIIKDFIPASQKEQRPGYAMVPLYLTIHNTANTSEGADAEMHNQYLHNGAGGRTVGWHYTVDDKEIYQHLPTNENGWHAGDGENGTGNRRSIAIEICENSDGDFRKATKNAQWLIKKLMKEHKIPISRIVTHKHWSGKNCPRKLLDDWKGFIDEINGASNQEVDNYNGHSIVDYLNSIGKNASFPARRRYAAQYGIRGYRGTASQNLTLLHSMRGDSQKASYIGKRVESKHAGQLRFYNKPSWSDKYVVGYLKKGYGFPTIVAKLKVGNGYQYKVKNSKGNVYYVTASNQYVRVE
ncbi:N-acetylmuramoyl-L-alanine amidase [Virgibacillus salarius]|uniref:peptidoglycan recognition protein family protein n=1 Tax=Virgibacillus salarius TaxID=447199 RepID=UPI00248FA5C9|nr:N-acetylmuramoyl-L-alanine amidase [Virgibacillus salarius]WBX80616.1 N-acetylmuramoyl-L-alanine amidase [Virgibacillus salarius]